jgi:hypothetical protein
MGNWRSDAKPPVPSEPGELVEDVKRAAAEDDAFYGSFKVLTDNLPRPVEEHVAVIREAIEMLRTVGRDDLSHGIADAADGALAALQAERDR